MNIMISGRHVKVTKAMEEYAREKASKYEKIWTGINKVQVTMDVENDHHVVETVISIHGGENIRASVRDGDMYAALDIMEDKIEHQLRKLKSKMQDHHPNHNKSTKQSQNKSDEPSYQDIVNEEMNPS